MEAPEDVIDVTLMIGEEVLATGRAEVFRPDLVSAALGDGGIHTQCPKIIAKLFIGAIHHGCIGSLPASQTAAAAVGKTLSASGGESV